MSRLNAENIPPKNKEPNPGNAPRRTVAPHRLPSSITPYLQVAIELLVLAVWALIIGKPYLNFDPNVLPAGREFGSAIQTHNIWSQLRTCGSCILWNGSGQGGYPAFVDTHGSMPHPLVMIPTLIWGGLKGAKISLIIALWVAGFAQWWLARELKVGWLSRIWSALSVIAAGHLAGRMEMGVFGVFFSTAMTSLIFASLIHASRRRGPRSVVLLAVVIASSLLSGQGYLQIGLVFVIPVSLIFIYDGERWSQPALGSYLLAIGLGILLAAFYLLPLAHFLPNFAKDVDPTFASAQSLSYIPLNLVIQDPDFYRNEVLDKFSFPYLYTLYIGWIPVILAITGIGMGKRSIRRELIFLITCVLVTFFAASSLPFQWLVGKIPVLAGIRQPSLIAGLVVPPILGLSAYGLDKILKLDWPTLSLNFTGRSSLSGRNFSLRWLLLISLAFSLYQGYRFSRNWIYTDTIDEGIFQLLEELETETAQWVNPPFGEHYYLAAAVERELKISPGIRPWHWKGREYPVPSLEAFRGDPPQDTVKITEVDQVGIYARPQELYAAVLVNGDQQPCLATSTGGKITVFCENKIPGKLVVKENTWTGWKAWMDGKRIELVGLQWLTVDAAAGKHTYQFRYQPWDFPLGLGLSLASVLACVYLWFFGHKHSSLFIS